MRYALNITAVLMTLTPTLLSAQQPASGSHYFCFGERFPAYGTPESRQPHVVYIAPAFDASEANIGTVSSEFKSYLRQKYKLNASTAVSCDKFPTLAAAQAARQKKQQDVDDRHQTEVDEAWTYAPHVAAAQPAKAAPAATAVKAAPNASQPKPAAAAKPAQSPAAAVTPPAAAQPAAQPAKLVDPRLAQIMEPYRTMANKEADHQARDYCEFNVRAFVGFDCNKFAKVLLEYRIAHASSYHALMAPKDDGGYKPLNTLIVRRELPCPDCLDSAKTDKQARELVLGELRPQLMAKVITQAKADAIASCAVAKYADIFKTRPHPADVWGDLDDARNACM